MATVEKTATTRKRAVKAAVPEPALSRGPEGVRAADDLARLAEAMGAMCEAQTTGDYEAYVDVSEFSGPAAQIAGAANRAVRFHVEAILDMLGLVARYADGDLSESLRPFVGKEAVANQITDRLRGALTALVEDAGALVEAARAGEYGGKLDAERHGGCFRQILDAMSACVGVAADRVYWYESLLDAIPFPISVTDIDMNWTFINRPVEDLLGLKRARVLGQHCSRWSADICETERCGIAGLRRGVGTSTFRNAGVDRQFQVDTSYILNREGERVGHIEVVQDITASTRAHDFMAAEVARLSSDMERLAAGDLEFESVVSAGYAHTTRVREELVVIADNVNHARDAIRALVADASTLVKGAVEGRLGRRANAGEHRGDFRRIVEGINATLDAVEGPIQEATGVLERVAERDLTARMAGDYQGDHARIKDALNQAAANLDGGMQQVAMAAEQVSSAARQIGSGSQTVAQGASEQASALERISSSLQEMASMTRQNAANAQEARGLSDAARSSVATGVDSMRRLSEAIDRIKHSSDDTAKIVRTIDEIAFQTNLLALNAAVEAARAGDAGKGFAVVAEEVRNLAMRSAEAARNTANLIEGSVKSAEQGVAINQEVFANLEGINSQVRKVGEVMAEIAAASEQQSEGIEQVNRAVGEMDQVTQQNAANSEESASAAEELASQSAEMNSLVATYQLTEALVAGRRSGVRGFEVLSADTGVTTRAGVGGVRPVRRLTPAIIPMPGDGARGRGDDDAILRSF